MVKLIPARKGKEETRKKKNPMHWAGIWSKKDAELIEKYAFEFRMKGKIIPA